MRGTHAISSGSAAAARGAAGLLVLISAVLVSACPGPVDEPGEVGEPRPGGTTVVALRSDFAGINSITNTQLNTDELIKYALFTPLVQYGDELDVEPYLAESWELLGDTAVVFSLRRDVRWHDGRPVTAQDVAFTFERAKDPATASLLASAYLDAVHTAEVVDSFTVRFGFEPHAQALESFWWAPMPRHLLEDVPPGELRNAPFNRRPVGSGPFRFVDWRANDRLTLERNPDFPEALGGPPYIERVVFRIIPEPATMLTEQITGRVDVMWEAEPEQAPDVQRGRDLRLFAFPARLLGYIGWNNARPPFDDARVRRAMTHAIDRQQIVDALLFGFGEIAMNTIPPWHPFHPEDVEPLPHDPGEAARLLDEAGWSLRPGATFRQNAAGQPLRFQITTSDAPLSRSVVEVVQAQLRQVGVDARPEIVEFGTLIAQHRARNFDAVFSNWVLDNFQMASAPAALFHSRWVPVEGSANRSSFADPRADELIDRGAVATDPAEAREIWREFTLLLQEQQPFTFMFWRSQLAAARNRVQNVEMDQRGRLLTLKDWWLVGRGTAPVARQD